MADKLTALKQAVEEILDDDHVTKVDEGEYRLEVAGNGGIVRVRKNDRGDFGLYFESGLPIPYMPTHERANKLVAWCLLD